MLHQTHQYLDTTEYYKSLTYATTDTQSSDASVRTWSIHPLNISEDIVIKKTLSYDDEPSGEVLFQTKGEYIMGTIKINNFLGEITALGALENVEKNINFMHNKAESWKCLYSNQNQCRFRRYSDMKIIMDFVVDQVCVAMVYITVQSGYTLPTRGSCVWT